MDFVTRDTYRHAIEDLSRGTGFSEIDVTTRVMDRARLAGVELHASEQPERDRRTDPGYYLISQGRRAFERELGYRVSWKHGCLRWYVRAPAWAIWARCGETAIVLAIPLWYALRKGVNDAGLVVLGLVALVPASDLAMALINRMVMAILGPRPLPRMALRNGIPKEFRTIVVVPTLLTSRMASMNRLSDWRCIIWRMRMMTCGLPCSQTGEMPLPKVCRVMLNCWQRPWRGLRI